MPSTQSRIIEQNASASTLFDIPIITHQADSSLVKSQVIEKDIASESIDTQKKLNAIFLDKKEETKLQKARRILGDDIVEVTDEELRVYIAEFEFLLDSWLNEYERKVFEGKTLKQLIKEGNDGKLSNK